MNNCYLFASLSIYGDGIYDECSFLFNDVTLKHSYSYPVLKICNPFRPMYTLFTVSADSYIKDDFSMCAHYLNFYE